MSYSFFLPLSTVGLEIRRLGLSRLPRLEPEVPTIRCEHEKSGDMIHLDIKKLGRIDVPGHRVTRDRSKRGRKAGWEYLHVCLDDDSRWVYSELPPDDKTSSAACILIDAVDWFKRHGLEVDHVLTNNSGCLLLFLIGCGYLGGQIQENQAVHPTHQRQSLNALYRPA